MWSEETIICTMALTKAHKYIQLENHFSSLFGPFQSTLDYSVQFGSLWSMLVLFGPFMSILDNSVHSINFGPFRSISVYFYLHQSI